MASNLKRLAEWAGIVQPSRYDDDDFTMDEYPHAETEADTEAVTAAVPTAARSARPR